MVALLAAVCLSQSPDLAADKRLDVPVSYTATGVQLSEALSGVSKSSGLSLRVAHPFDEDIVALRLSVTPLREFMTRLSSGLKLTWRATEQGYSLYQTAERAKVAAKELDFERINRLRGLRAEHLARFQLPRPDFDQATARLNAETSEPMPDPNADMSAYLERAKLIDALEREADPTRWLTSAVLANLSDAQLRTLQDDGAITFSSKPNRLQQALPKPAEKDLAAWAKRLTVTDYESSVRVRIADERQVIVDAVIFQDGKYLDSKGHFLQMQAEALAANSTDPLETQLDKTLQLDGFLGMRWRRPSKRHLSEKAIASLLKAMDNPSEHEFLRPVAGEALVELAEKTENQLIAFLHDDMMELGGQADLPVNGRKMLAQFCDEVRCVYGEESGWLTVVPRELSLARAKQFPRKHFITMRAAAGGILSLDQLARIAYECSDLQLESMFVRDQISKAVKQTDDSAVDNWGEISALRVWHSLRGNEAQRINNAGAVAVGELDTESKRLLWRACAIGRTSFQPSRLVFSDTFRDPKGNDPTRVYPNGFPADEPLELQTARQDIVLSKFSGGGPVASFLSLDIERFASMSKQNPVDMENVRVGKADLLRLCVDRVTWAATYRSEQYDFRMAPIPWSKAPEALRKQFDDVRARGVGEAGIR